MKRKAFALALGAALLFPGCTTVDEGTRAVKLVWGSAEEDPVEPGLYFVRMLAHNYEHISVRERKFEQSTSASTKDQQMVATVVAVNYKAKADKIVEIYSKLGKSPDNWDSTIIAPQIQEVLKSVTAKYTALELITKREEVKTKVTDVLTERITMSNFEVVSVAITDFQFSATYMQSIEAKQVAEQDALRAQNELDRNALEVQKVEQKAKSDKQAAITAAEGKARALEIEAKAIADWHKTVGAAATNDSNRYAEIQKWNGVAPQFVSDGGMLLPATK